MLLVPSSNNWSINSNQMQLPHNSFVITGEFRFALTSTSTLKTSL